MICRAVYDRQVHLHSAVGIIGVSGAPGATELGDRRLMAGGSPWGLVVDVERALERSHQLFYIEK